MNSGELMVRSVRRRMPIDCVPLDSMEARSSPAQACPRGVIRAMFSSGKVGTYVHVVNCLLRHEPMHFLHLVNPSKGNPFPIKHPNDQTEPPSRSPSPRSPPRLTLPPTPHIKPKPKSSPPHTPQPKPPPPSHPPPPPPSAPTATRHPTSSRPEPRPENPPDALTPNRRNPSRCTGLGRRLGGILCFR